MSKKVILKTIVGIVALIAFVIIICLMDKFLIIRYFGCILFSVAGGLKIGEMLSDLSNWLAKKFGLED